MLTTRDPAELPEASCAHAHTPVEAICPRCHLPGDAICPHCKAEYTPDSFVEDNEVRVSSPQEIAQRFAKLARLITSKRNSKFWWACLLVATGDAAAGGISMAELGKQFSVTRACVSKTCVAICKELGLPPSRYMMSEAARVVHRCNNRRNEKV
jgi:hypothetical protein